MTTEYSEAALARRREKFAHVAAFPGMLPDWGAATGRTVAAIASEGEARLVLFTDGCFLVSGTGPDRGDALLTVLNAAGEVLAAAQPGGWDELQQRIAAETEAMRLARMEKVLGAVETNLPRIPELRAALRALVAEGDAG